MGLEGLLQCLRLQKIYVRDRSITRTLKDALDDIIEGGGVEAVTTYSAECAHFRERIAYKRGIIEATHHNYGRHRLPGNSCSSVGLVGYLLMRKVRNYNTRDVR